MLCLSFSYSAYLSRKAKSYRKLFTPYKTLPSSHSSKLYEYTVSFSLSVSPKKPILLATSLREEQKFSRKCTHAFIHSFITNYY